MATIPFRDTRDRLMADPEFKREYDALEEEFSLIKAMIRARARAGLTQTDVARAMGVSQPRIARIESGKNVSLETLKRYAHATGSKLTVDFERRDG